IGRARVGRMVQHDENEIYVRREVVQLVGQPLALLTGDFFECTVEHENESVAGSYRIETTLLEVRKALEIVAQSDIQVAMKIVVAESGVNRNVFLAENASLRIPGFPIVRIVAVVDDVTGEADERWIRVGNRFYKSDSHC